MDRRLGQTASALVRRYFALQGNKPLPAKQVYEDLAFCTELIKSRTHFKQKILRQMRLRGELKNVITQDHSLRRLDKRIFTLRLKMEPSRVRRRIADSLRADLPAIPALDGAETRAEEMVRELRLERASSSSEAGLDEAEQ